MSRRALLVLLSTLALLVAAVPAVAKHAHSSSAPVVTSIHPTKLKIGQRLTIRGRGFIPGRHRDTVVFMGSGKRVVWVKADSATRTRISVVLPAKLNVILNTKNGVPQATHLQIRVIAKKSGRKFTSRSKSPLVSPSSTLSGGGGGSSCAGVTTPGADSDGDMLSNALEVALGTNPCKADTDGDGIPDGYEYQSALDLNRNANSSAIPWPYPGKKPYPNPLYNGDADTDFDGDSLTLREEYTASFARTLGIDPQHHLQTFLPYAPNPNPQNNVMVVAYSDGDQTTNPTAQGNLIGVPNGPAAPCDPAQSASTQSGFDVNGNGTVGDAGDVLSYQGSGGFVDNQSTPLGWMNEFNWSGQADCFLSDDEKDIDGDGLSNYTEAHGPLGGQAWWNKYVPLAGNYTPDFAGTNWLDPDTDGDGVPDGADDQDHDGYTNIEESLPVGNPQAPASLQAKSVWHYPVENDNPNVDAFNPCLPNVMSPACPRHPVTKTYGPFMDGSVQNNYAQWPRP